MLFLNGALLAFLGVLGIPLLLHLLNPRRRRVHDLSSLRFLKRIESSRLRRLKVRRLLLLLVRTALLLLLVAAFARPVLRAPGALGGATREPVRAVILFDNSFSTGFPAGGTESAVAAESIDAIGGPSAFELLKEDLRRLLAEAGADDSYALIPLARPVTRTAGVRDAAGLMSELGALDLSKGSDDPASAVRLALEVLDRWPGLNRELHLFSDMRLEVPADSLGRELPGDLRLFLHPRRTSTADNRLVAEVQLRTRIMRSGEPVVIQTLSPAAQAGSRIELDLLVEEETLGRRSLGADEDWVEFQLRPQQAGALRATLRLSGDAFAADNLQHFTLVIPERLRVLLAAPTGESREALRAALLPDERYGREFELSEIEPRELARAALWEQDVLVLAPGRRLPESVPGRGSQAVESRLGLLLLPGEEFAQGAGSRLFEELGLPPVRGVVDSRGGEGPGAGLPGMRSGAAWRLQDYDLEHPLFRGVMQGDDPPAPTAIHRYLVFAGSSGLRTIAALDGGQPILAEGGLGAGRILVFGTGPASGWSELRRSGVFAPLVSRGARYLAAAGDPSPGVYCGEGATLELRGLSGDERIRLRGPAGEFLLNSGAGRSMFRTPPLDLPGHYDVLHEEELLGRLAVNVDPRESLAAECPPARLENWTGRSWRRLEAGDSLAEARLGREIWWTMLLLALILLAIESLLSTGGRP